MNKVTEVDLQAELLLIVMFMIPALSITIHACGSDRRMYFLLTTKMLTDIAHKKRAQKKL